MMRTLAVAIVWAAAAGSAWAQYEGARSVPAQYPTIQSAIDAANVGDRILIAPGSYSGGITVSKRLHLVGTGPGVILMGNGSDTVLWFQKGGTLRNVVIEKAGGVLDLNGWNGQAGVRTGGAAEAPAPFRMRGCEVRQCGVGVVLDGESVVQNSRVHDCGVGVWTPPAADLPHTTRVYNNVFHNNGRAVVQSLQQNAHVITNCIFHFNSAALHTDVGSGSQTSYNDFWGNDAVYYGSASLPPAGNYAVDPQFVDPAGGNFHLQSTSPLVNHGSPALLNDDLTVSDVGMYGGPMPRLRLLAVSPSKGTVTTIFRFAVVLHDVVPPAPFLSPPGTDASAVAGQAVPALHLWGTGANLFVKPTTSDATPADGAKSVYYFGPLGYQDKFKFRYETRTPFGEWLYGPSTTGYRSFTVGPDLSGVAREEVHSPAQDFAWDHTLNGNVIGFGMGMTPRNPYNGFKGRLYYRRNGGPWMYRTANRTHNTADVDYFHMWVMVGLHVFPGDTVEYYYWGRDGNGPDFMDRNDADGAVKHHKITIK